jgi:beta-phosphoglucomutase-like phosphatase (HAD superfamily)
MTSIAPVVTLSPRDYDAVLFYLDGVLTKTASVHASAWKRLFDGFLERRAADIGESFVPFDIDADYRRYVDGKPRYDGVAAFMVVPSYRSTPYSIIPYQTTTTREARSWARTRR